MDDLDFPQMGGPPKWLVSKGKIHLFQGQMVCLDVFLFQLRFSETSETGIDTPAFFFVRGNQYIECTNWTPETSPVSCMVASRAVSAEGQLDGVVDGSGEWWWAEFRKKSLPFGRSPGVTGWRVVVMLSMSSSRERVWTQIPAIVYGLGFHGRINMIVDIYTSYYAYMFSITLWSYMYISIYVLYTCKLY